MPSAFRNGRASSSSAGVWASACSCSGSNGGNMWPAIEEMTIPAAPGAITRPNSSNTSAVPSRSTASTVAAGAWTAETPAVWTTWVTVPSSAAFPARACTDSREETSTRWVLTRWPRPSSAAAAAAWLSSLMSAKRMCLPGPWRRAMAWPMPPAPVMTRTSSLLLMSGSFGLRSGGGRSVRHERLGGRGVVGGRGPGAVAFDERPGQERADGQQRGRPPERGGVAVGAGGGDEVRCGARARELAGHGADGERAEQGGAERAADLLHGVDGGAGGPGVGRVDAEGGGAHGQAHDAAQAEGHDDEPGHDAGEVGGLGVELGEEHHADRGERHAGGDRRSCAEARGRAWGELHRGQRDDDRRGQERQAGHDRREAEVLLKVVGEKEEDGEQTGAVGRQGDERAAAVAVKDDAQRQQRVCDTALDGDEEAEQDEAGGDEAERRGGAPAVGLGLREAVHEREETQDGGDGAGEVGLRAGAAGLVMQERKRAGGGRDRDSDVDVQ